MFIKRAKIDKLLVDMVEWRDLAHQNYRTALAIENSYIDKFKSGVPTNMTSVSDAERKAAEDIRFVNAVANNQMYDRFATRDAAVLTALASLTAAGLLTVNAEPNNPLIEPLTKNQY